MGGDTIGTVDLGERIEALEASCRLFTEALRAIAIDRGTTLRLEHTLLDKADRIEHHVDGYTPPETP